MDLLPRIPIFPVWRINLPICGMVIVVLGGSAGCRSRSLDSAGSAASSSPSANPIGAAASGSASASISHGELDTPAPANAPQLAATVIAATIYKAPDTGSRRLGYLRLGGAVRRDREPVRGVGCKEEWYRIYPMGFVCLEQATIDLEDPTVRATVRRPDREKPLPYRYGFIRATSPQYLRIPSRTEQLEAEFKLEEHLATFEQSRQEWQKVVLGANDVPLDPRGIPVAGLKRPPGVRPAYEWSEIELFGGTDGRVPWWLDGGRKIPNLSAYKAPENALFADRIRRKTGLSFVGAFQTESEGMRRDFGVAVDMRLIPLSKVKPDSGSPFHGLEIPPTLELPFAWVTKNDVQTWKLIKDKDETKSVDAVPFRAVVPLTGHARIKAGKRFYQTRKDKRVWLRADDLSVVFTPTAWPEPAAKGEKWVDISIAQQTLVLYQGQKPWYATLVSTGRDGMGDPEKTLSTPRGTFRIQSKHLSAAMDSEENSSLSGGARARKTTLPTEVQATLEKLQAAKKQGKRLSAEDERRLLNVEKGRHPEYGVTQRRGSQNFELRDVPWIQYFAAGYALHGAYWHDVFGVPRSHGCVNLAPVDARVVFTWTDPPLPEAWHGVNLGEDMGQGTVVFIHE